MMNNPCKKSHLGLTLIEVLIAAMVVSIGFLGIARLQLVSLKQTHAAYLHSVAETQLLNMVECLRLTKFKYSCQQEKSEWELQLAAQLPEGMGKIYKKANAFQVVVAWNEEWIGHLETSCPNGIASNLTCLVMDVAA